MDLSRYTNPEFNRGRSKAIEALWLMVDALWVRSWIPGRRHRIALLRAFGARIGQGVDIKPGVKVKFPWRLHIGDYSWVGEAVWIDNLAAVVIGSNCCISQGAYLCTGSHDWRSPTFQLKTASIRIEDQSWIAAFARIGPGVTVAQGSIIALGGVATQSTQPWMVYRGNPAEAFKSRTLNP